MATGTVPARSRAQSIGSGRADEGAQDQEVRDRKQGGAGDQEQPAVPQGQAQPHGARRRPPQAHGCPVIGWPVIGWPVMRYPALGSVSISGGSPSLARRPLTVIFTAAVNGSAFSSHARSSSSSADTARPAPRRAVSSTRSPPRSTGGMAGWARRNSALIRATSTGKSNGLGR